MGRGPAEGAGHQVALVVETATQLPGAVLDHPFGPDAEVYKVAGKMFALLSGSRGGERVNLKVHPDDGPILRAQHRAITPGWHMDKRHWVTVALDGSVPDGLVAQLVEDSYELVVAGLPRRARLLLGDPDRS